MRCDEQRRFTDEHDKTADMPALATEGREGLVDCVHLVGHLLRLQSDELLKMLGHARDLSLQPRSLKI